MIKKCFFIASLFLTTAVCAQNQTLEHDILSNYKQLSAKQIFDTANYFFENNHNDKALILYNLLLNVSAKDNDLEQQKRMIGALSNSAAIYYYSCDYRSAYDFLMKALLLCEKVNDKALEAITYTNIGNIYYRFNKHDMAKLYYSKALNLCKDSLDMVIILNNLGASEIENNRIDSAFYFLNKSLKISKLYDNFNLHTTLNSFASLYEKQKRYDSAFFYYRLSLAETKSKNKVEKEAQNLSDLGKLFFEVKKIDSALFYIDLSNNIAKNNNFLTILADNYLTLSKIEKSKGDIQNAFTHYQTYVNLRDSVFNTDKFYEINQLQRLYEVKKTNQQIEQLVFEQQVKERTILYQRIIWIITLIVLLFVSGVLLIILTQKRKLDTAYKRLFEKNIKIMELQDHSAEMNLEKYKKSALTDELQNELLERILALMEDTSIICDTEFSLDKLAELTQSNHAYVSQVVNTALRKNFRSFLNEYRIREAQRLFSEFDIAKYTIESVASQVGFKSPTTFRDAFKEITGVNPNFYLKLMQEKNSV